MNDDSNESMGKGRPLDGVVVVSLEQAVAAPMCSGLLASAGARVIKAERVEGDFARRYDGVVHGESAYFVWLNAGKESICVDLTTASDRTLLEDLIAHADVFIQNLAPGATARLGFGSESLRARHPRLITVDVSGYGEHGDYAQMKAYDLLIQGESGLASITGGPEAPGRVGVSICDIASGMYAYAGTLEALLQRHKTGRGSGIHVSLFGAAANWMSVPLLHHDYGGAAPTRQGLSHPSIAPYGAFQSADGMPILIAVQNEREWRSFCAGVLEAPAVASMPAFATNQDRVAHRRELDEMIGGILMQIDHVSLAKRLTSARIAWGRVNSVAELSDHPQLRRELISSPTGPVNRIAHPIESTTWHPPGGAVPGLGQHDSSVRKEFRRSSQYL